MEVEEASRTILPTLPDELVERIVARIPFPFILKARSLSKSWLVRFSPIVSTSSSRDGDEEKKLAAASFQKQVCELCDKWGTFSPISVDKTNSLAYNPAAHAWSRFPSLRFLRGERYDLQLKGTLLLASRLAETKDCKKCRCVGLHHGINSRKELYVANILTRRWKRLPPHHVTLITLSETLLMNKSSETYMVFACGREHDPQGRFTRYHAQIYDSKSASWSARNKIRYRFQRQFHEPVDPIRTITSPAYFNGVLYLDVEFRRQNSQSIVSWDFAAGDWRKLRSFSLLGFPWAKISSMIFYSPAEATIRVHFLVCISNLMMVVSAGNDPSVEALAVMKVDLVKNEFKNVPRDLPKALRGKFKAVRRPVSDGNSIFLGMNASDGTMVAYNVHKRKWICFDSPPTEEEMMMVDLKAHETPSYGQGTKRRRTQRKPNTKVKHYEWCASSFQPGLNPFIAV